MASTVDICNRGLQKLGAQRISSLSDESKNARACLLAYGPVLRRILRKHTWSCATKRASLAADVTAPLFGRTSSFTVPADFLRLLPPDPTMNFNDLDYQVEGKKIVTDQSGPLLIRYVYEITDPNEMDALLQELVSTELAFELCEELTQSNSKKEGLREDVKQIIADAKKTNAIENVAQLPPEDEWVTVRS